MYTMGERIRQAREDMGYTRETFSEMANITPRFCYDIESGKKGVSIDTLKIFFLLFLCFLFLTNPV